MIFFAVVCRGCAGWSCSTASVVGDGVVCYLRTGQIVVDVGRRSCTVSLRLGGVDTVVRPRILWVAQGAGGSGAERSGSCGRGGRKLVGAGVERC